jgi:hypothetical protein
MLTIQYFLATLAVLALLWLVGQPARLALEHLAAEPLRALPTPVLGAATIVVLGWTWYQLIGPLWPLVLMLAGAGSAISLRQMIATRGWSRRQAGPSKVAWVAVLAFGLLGTVSIGFGSIGDLESRTVATAGNNDLALFVYLGQHALESSADEAGNIAGYDAGFRLTDDAGAFDWGVYAVMAAASIVSVGTSWPAAQPLLFAAISLTAMSLALVARDLLRRGPVISAAIAVIAVSTALTGYIVAQGFLNQMLAIALVTSAAAQAMLSLRSTTTRVAGSHACAAGLLTAAGIAGYPHMAILGLPLLLAPLIAADAVGHRPSRAGLLTASRRLLITAAGTLATILVVVPDRVVNLRSTLAYLRTIEAGWPLGVLLPQDLLGFVDPSWMTVPLDLSTSGLSSISVTDAVIAAAIMLALGGACLVVWRSPDRHIAAFSAAAVVVVFGSYYLLYIAAWGTSYRQWKYVTFLVPFLVFSVCLLVQSLLSRFRTTSPNTVQAGVGMVGILLILGSLVGLSLPSGRPPGAVMTADQRGLEGHPAFAGIESVNVDVREYWDTMWVAYFLRDLDQVYLLNPSYYPVSAPGSPWTLTRADSEAVTTVDPGSVIAVNSTYVLVRQQAAED